MHLQVQEIKNIEDGDVVSLEIVSSMDEELEGVLPLEKLNRLFQFSSNDVDWEIDHDDLVSFFIFYTATGEVNPSEEFWIWAVVDDFYFRDTPFTVDIDADKATYSGELDYESGAHLTFYGVIDTKYGIVVLLDIQ
ncbi:MAG: hypothetical protein ACW99Q_06155, partial [Candidatus Kariarchaeaceae archaeon]